MTKTMTAATVAAVAEASPAEIAACTKLKAVVVSKDTYPAAETDALDALIKKNNKYGKIRLY